MNRCMKIIFKIPVYLIFFVFLVSAAGCGSSGNVKVMPAMQNKTDSKTKYNVAVAESRTIDKILSVDAWVSSNGSEELSFKIDDCHLKAVYVKKDDNVIEGQLLAELDASSLENQLALRQIDLEKVQLNYNHILSESDTETADRNIQLENLKLDMESIMLDINRINESINETRLVAPFSGVIADIRYFQLGETVTSNEKFITIYKPGSITVLSATLKPRNTAESDGIDLSGVITGMKVSIIQGSQNKKIEIPATITRIINTVPGILPDPGKNLTAPPPFDVYVKPDGGYADKLLADQMVSIRINAGKLENVVMIPKSAIRGNNDDKIVKVLKGDKVINRRVTTGYEDYDDKIVVITSGLRSGESVVMN